MFANLLCAVLAVAVSAAPFVGEVNRDVQFAPDSVSAVADADSYFDNDRLYFGSYNGRQVKNAYYDPAETYGNDPKIYNYTSYYCSLGESDGSVGHTLAVGDSYVYESWYISGSNKTSYSTEFSDYAYFSDEAPTSPYDFVGDIVSVDMYVDGAFFRTLQLASTDYETNAYVISFTLDGDTTSDLFPVWLFDHQEPEAVNPGVEILGDIAEGLTGGIVPVAEGIGGGLQTLVSKIFLNADGTGLSLFGIVSVCFAGLALAIGLSRWIVNFVASLGARNR